YDLARDERLGTAARRPALDAAQMHRCTEGLGPEPTLRLLRREAAHQVVDLATRDGRRERHEEVWPTQVAFVLRDLVLEDQVVAERLPSELGDQTMVLVTIVERVREHDVGRWPRGKRGEQRLQLRKMRREVPVADRVHHDRPSL